MAQNKEAIAIILDVGPAMSQAPSGEVTFLETSLEAISMILQRKMFSESKDEVALVLFGTPETENPLAGDEHYKNISVVRKLGPAEFDLLEYVKNDVQSSNISGDFIDALIVGMDHLVKEISGRRRFEYKRLILFSNLGGEFGDDQMDKIIAGMINMRMELNVVGPDLNDEDDDDDSDDDQMVNGMQKAKTKQQRTGETYLKKMLKKVEGSCYSFREVLPALSFFQTRQTRPTAWKCPLEIGSSLQIPICGFLKVKDFKLKQSWKKVYAKDVAASVATTCTYHMNDEEETEVDVVDIVEGHRYGNTLVAMSEDDKANMEYKAEKCFKVLGFTKMDNVPRHHHMGDSVMAVFAEKDDKIAGVALSALINALYDTNMVAIVRRVYDARASPRIGYLMPYIKSTYECLFWIELPFMEDLRRFTFGSLPIKDDIVVNKKYTPSEEQLAAIDNLITSMDLSEAGEKDASDDESCEALKPKLTFNPYFQRLYQCLQHKALNPNEPLPELSPLIASYLKPPPRVISSSQEPLDKLKNIFKLEPIAQKKDQTGENIFKEKDAVDLGPNTKKVKLDDGLEGGLAGITLVQVTEVGTVTPVDDFKAIIAQKDEDKFNEACKQMQARIGQMVTESIDRNYYSKAMDCLKVLRLESRKKSEPDLFNQFLMRFKDLLMSKTRSDFWEDIVKEKLGLITKFECEDSRVTSEEADLFLSTAEEEEEKQAKDEAESADELLGML